jgi:hypothetical protein
MSRPEHWGRWTAGIPVGLAFLAVGLTPSYGQNATTPAAPASNANAQQSAYRSSIAEETVRKDADKIQIQMAQLVAELKLNGISGSNLSTLSNASTHLSGMSQEDMQKVINALQSASITPEDAKRNQSLVSAYQGQQELVAKLKGLAASLTQQQASDQLTNQISALIARQSANIRQTATLLPGRHTVDALTEQEKTVHGIATAEQKAISDQIDLIISSLSGIASNPPATPDATYKTSKAVYEAMTGTLLKDTAHMAAQMTEAGPFPPAMDRQMIVKQYLIGVLRVAAAKSDAAAKLAQAKNVLDQVKQDQKDLNDATKNSKVDPKTLADRQAEINDRAEVAKAMLASLNPDAAKQVATAQKDMQKSADELNKPQQNPSTDPAAQQKQDDAAKQAAATQQDAAQQALTDASQKLDQQIADVQAQQNQTPTEQLAQLQKAQDEIKQAQMDQQVSPQQAAQDAQKAQQDAMAQSPDAADKLADATTALQQQAQQQGQQPQDPQQAQNGQQPPQGQQPAQPQDGQQQAQNGQPQQGQQPGQQNAQANADAASQALAQAAADIQAQKDALAQAAADYQALAQASQALDQATKDTAAADKSLQDGQGKDLSDPAKNLADAQQQVAQAGQTPPGQDPTQGLPQDAKDALAKAADALKNGSIKAVQSDRKGADAQAQQALAALQDAKGSVDKAMADVQAKSQMAQGKGKGDEKGDGKDQMAQNGDMKNGEQNPGQDKGLIKGSYGAKATNGSALVVGGLSPKDRDAITQFQAEKTPPEYAPLVQQYLKNLAEASDSH